MDKLKLPIALVAIMACQLAAGVWWVSQQASTVSDLEETVGQLGSRMAIEDGVNLRRDVAQNAEQIEDLYDEVDAFAEMLTRQLEILGRVSTLEAQIEYMRQ